MTARTWRLFVAAGCATVLGFAPGAGAQDMAGEQPVVAADKENRIDPKVSRILERASAAYQGVQRIRCEVRMDAVLPDGFEAGSVMKVAAERPRRLSLRYEDGSDSYALVSDGKTLHHYMGGGINMHSEEPAPETFEGIADAAAMSPDVDERGLDVFMTPHFLILRLLGGEGLEAIAADVKRGTLIGIEEIDGVPHERVRLEGERLNVDVWIAEGEQAWIGRILPDMTPMFEEMREMLGDRADELAGNVPKITINFNDWSTPEGFEADVFAFEAPEGATKVASIGDAMRAQFEEDMDQGQGPGGEQGHAELLGKPAPALDIDLLDGGKATIPEGKVVVLDFWATWCPPCIRGLPIFASVAQKYKGRDVVFYAVNVQEGAEAVRAFLERRELALTVPMDAEGKVSERYRVSGIPQTVVIGKDGTVQAVHVGLLPDMEEQLSREIDTLLKGDSLVKK